MLTRSEQAGRPLTAEERALLARFASFDIGLDELILRLKGMLDIDFGTGERKLTSYFTLPEPGIRIQKEHIVRALDKHWRGEVTDDQLYRWAVMLLLNEAYDWEGPDEEYIAEALNEFALPPRSGDE